RYSSMTTASRKPGHCWIRRVLSSADSARRRPCSGPKRFWAATLTFHYKLEGQPEGSSYGDGCIRLRTRARGDKLFGEDHRRARRRLAGGARPLSHHARTAGGHRPPAERQAGRRRAPVRALWHVGPLATLRPHRYSITSST